ncbi:MAG: hypothetical protein WBV93_13140 [Anaerobacillus sp.]
MLRYVCLVLLFSPLFFPIDSSAAGPVQLVQGKCPQPDQLVHTHSQEGLSSKATVLLSGLMAHKQDTQSWQMVSITKLKKKSHYYSPVVKTCKQEIAKHTFIVDILITKKSSTLPERLHLFAVKETEGWKIWGLTAY